MVLKDKARDAVTICLWAGAALFIFLNRKSITPSAIASFLPGPSVLSALVIMLLFALKSLTVVVYAGILYAATSLIFPVWQALFINVLGTVVMVSLPYVIGCFKGRAKVEEIEERFPKLRDNILLQTGHQFRLLLVLRLAKILPYDIVGMYLGAKQVRYLPYLAVSVVCMTDNIVLLTLMGSSFMASNTRLTVITACAEVLIIGVCLVWVWLYSRRVGDGR